MARRGRQPIRCRFGWHAYDYRITYAYGPTYEECAHCIDRRMVRWSTQIRINEES